MIPLGEWRPDLPEQGAHLVDAKNVIADASSYRSFPSMAAYSSALNSLCTGALAVKSVGTPSNFAGTATKLYLLSGATYNDVSIAANYTGSTEFRWSFATFGKRVIATNFSNNPQSYVIGTSTLFADLTTAFKARYVGVVRDFVAFAYTSDATNGAMANNVRWSAINDPTDYTASVITQSDSQQVNGDGELGDITGFVGGERGVVFFEGGIFLMTYVGAPVVFNFDQIVFGTGCVAPGTIASYGEKIFYLGPDGFYMLGGAQAIPIGNQKIDKWFYSDFDQSMSHLANAVIDPINTLYIIAYPGAGNSGICNRVIMFNWVTGRWSYASPGNFAVLVNSMSQSVDPDAASTETIYGNPDTGPFADVSLDSRIFIGGKLQLSAIDANHKLAYFNSTALTATLETGETQLFPGKRALVKNVRPMIEGTGTVSVEAGTRDITTATVSYTAPSTVNSYGEANLFAEGRYHRARVTITGGFYHAYGIDWNAVPKGKY